MMDERGCDTDQLAVWVLSGCDPREEARLRAHLDVCPFCRARAMTFRETAGWLGRSVPAAEPPAAPRSRVLAEARSRRPAGAGPLGGALRRWAEQVAALDAELASLSAAQWLAPVERHSTVRGVVAHLAASDRLVTEALDPTAEARPAVHGSGVGWDATAGPDDPEGWADVADWAGMASWSGGQGGEVAEPEPARAAWRQEAERLLRRVGGDGEDLAGRPVLMAGRWAAVRPLSDAVVQRGFETWIHADDVRAALGRPVRTAPPDQVRAIIDLGTRLLPGTLLALGRHRPSGTALLVLTGPGGGEWTVRLHPEAEAGAPPTATITAGAAGFCRLMAGRRAVEGYPYEVSGSAAVAADLLAAVSTLGCD